MKKAHFYRNRNGDIYSAFPPQTFLTFDYWIFMVPQYKPKNVLILGYGAGTIAGLIKMIWGEDIPITGVDLKLEDNIYDDNLIQADAKEFVKACSKFDTVIVDLFDIESNEPCDFVGDKEFVNDLERISDYLIVNSLHTDMSAYNHLRKVGQNKPSRSSEVIYYFQITDSIPNLKPHK